MDLEQEDFSFTLNKKDKTLWTKVKDFFNPHIPLHQLAGADKKPQNDSVADSHSHSHSDASAFGHSHSHASDPEALKLYNTKEFWTNEGVKITWVGFGVNCSMAVSKFIGGIYFHSQALIADSVHAVGDLFSDILTLSTVKYSNQTPNQNYPLGFGKVETLGSMLVSGILLYAGFSIGWSSFIDVITPIVPHSIVDILSMVPSHSHSHSHAIAETAEVASDLAHSTNEVAHDLHDSPIAESVQVANINAAWLALGSIVVKEWLFQATRKVGEKLNSKVLIANAWHHRVDSLTSMVAVATISCGYFLNIYWLDSIGGLLVSILIMKVGISGVFQSFKELIDKSVPRDDQRYTSMEDKLNVLLMKKDSQIIIKDLVLLPSGTNLNVSMKLGCGSYNRDYENKLTLDKIGDISRYLDSELKNQYHNIKRVSIEFVSNEPLRKEEEESKEEESKEEESESGKEIKDEKSIKN
ncbi:unnamed protein product [[Candida] boidinii]|nr:unnamed protein product [[Candida] boidinii]